MPKVSVEMESYGMNPETLQAVVEHELKAGACSLSGHLRLGVSFKLLSLHQGTFGTCLTSLRADIEAETLDAHGLDALVRNAMAAVSDGHRHGEYVRNPEAFRYDVV